MSLASDLAVGEAPAQTGVGVIAPGDFARDRELWRWAPEHVSLHLTRLPVDLGGADVRSLTVRAARDLADPASISTATLDVLVPQPALVAYACAAGSFVRGAAGERAVCGAMLEAGASAACTTSGALVDELRARGVSRLGLVTPYPAPVTRRLAAFLAEHDVDVVSTVPFRQLVSARATGSADAAGRMRAHAWGGAEAIFFCCTNVATYDLIEPLGSALGTPVLTANEVLMHAALRALRPPPAPGP